jgi:DNA topoisomerase II
MKLSDFLNTDYCNYAAYDNTRKIGSLVDGLKISARKVLNTVLKDNINKDIKVENLMSRVAEQNEYLHGASSLGGVIVNMARRYVGSNNNIPLLHNEGNFGTRFINENSATRYIYTRKEQILDYLFIKEDFPILIGQNFEGTKIEPRYFVPIIPLLLVNGSDGISVGFAQTILPRKPKDVINYLVDYLDNKQPDINKLLPYYKGFTGGISRDPESSTRFFIKGKFIRESTTNLVITELPVKYQLEQYLDVLDDLEERHIIKGFKDESTDDVFKFRIKITREFSELTDEEILLKLKLIQTESENYTCLDENNKIFEATDLNMLMQRYITIRLNTYTLRKNYMLKTLSEDLKLLISKYMFIKNVIEGTIKINNIPINDIYTCLATIKNIVKIDDSYEYLMNIKASNFTKEFYEELIGKIRKLKTEFDELKNKSEKDIWKEELLVLSKSI